MARTVSSVASSSKTVPKVEEIKSEFNEDGDALYVFAGSEAPRVLTDLKTRIKIEEDQEKKAKINGTALSAPVEDIFEDVDDEDEEPEYVDLTYEGIAEVNGVRHFICEGFKIRQLPDPFIVKRSLIDLFNYIESGAIVLDPASQRDVGWEESRAALLCTSILMGYFIPPIIFNVKKTIVKTEGRTEHKYTRICVDGKQRLTSIWKFMKGMVGFFDTNTPQRRWYYTYQIVNGKIEVSHRLILPAAVKKFFEQQFFVCYEYEDLSVDTEDTMFQLVQRGVALTPAEKMRAMNTEWAAFTRKYEEDYVLITNLSKQNHHSGFRLILTIFTMIQEVFGGNSNRRKNSSSVTPTLQASPIALTRIVEDRTPINPALKLKFKAIFDKFESLVKQCSNQITTTSWRVRFNSVFDPAPEYLRLAGVPHGRTFSPLELIVTAILIAVHMDNSTDRELLEDIQEMRRFMRERISDLRVNTKCWAVAWEYIIDECDKRKVARQEAASTQGADPDYQSPYAPDGRSIISRKVGPSGEIEMTGKNPAMESLFTRINAKNGQLNEDIMFPGLMGPRRRARQNSGSSSPLSSAPSSEAEDSDSDATTPAVSASDHGVKRPRKRRRLVQKSKINAKGKGKAYEEPGLPSRIKRRGPAKVNAVSAPRIDPKKDTSKSRAARLAQRKAKRKQLESSDPDATEEDPDMVDHSDNEPDAEFSEAEAVLEVGGEATNDVEKENELEESEAMSQLEPVSPRATSTSTKTHPIEDTPAPEANSNEQTKNLPIVIKSEEPEFTDIDNTHLYPIAANSASIKIEESITDASEAPRIKVEPL